MIEYLKTPRRHFQHAHGHASVWDGATTRHWVATLHEKRTQALRSHSSRNQRAVAINTFARTNTVKSRHQTNASILYHRKSRDALSLSSTQAGVQNSHTKDRRWRANCARTSGINADSNANARGDELQTGRPSRSQSNLKHLNSKQRRRSKATTAASHRTIRRTAGRSITNRPFNYENRRKDRANSIQKPDHTHRIWVSIRPRRYYSAVRFSTFNLTDLLNFQSLVTSTDNSLESTLATVFQTSISSPARKERSRAFSQVPSLRGALTI